MFKKIFLIGMVVVLVGGSLFFFYKSGSAKKEELKTILAEKGSIIDKALAVGKIEPRQEISVKSKLSGIIKTIFADIGDTVSIGDPLFDIAPDPTPIEMAEARRQVEIFNVTFANAKKEADRSKSLVAKNLVSQNGRFLHTQQRDGIAILYKRIACNYGLKSVLFRCVGRELSS